MHLLVSGGAGFIGSNFCRWWSTAEPGSRITVIDALTYAGDTRNLEDVEATMGAAFTFVRADIADSETITDAVARARPDVIVNFAAESHNSRAVVSPGAFVRTNVVGTQVLLDAARAVGVPRFHHVSTCEVYGDLAIEADTAFTEDSPYRPRTPYSASKAGADLLVRAYVETYGIAATISNCSNNYGPWQHPEKVIPTFITSAIEGRPLPLYRQSQHKREWLHVDDHCRAIALVIERGRTGETYNVGSGDERSIEQLADAILTLAGRSADLKQYVTDRPSHDRRYLLDHSKIERELGWSPRIRFDDGLAATFDWYRAHSDWWGPKRAGIVNEFAWQPPVPSRSS